jgi:hypothetical protein
MIRAHYLEVVPKEEAEAWFSLVPPAPEKVIQFPERASEPLAASSQSA